MRCCEGRAGSVYADYCTLHRPVIGTGDSVPGRPGVQYGTVSLDLVPALGLLQ